MGTKSLSGHYAARERHSGEGEPKGEKTLTIYLPIPDQLLTDNVTRSLHWGAKGRHVKAQRSVAGWHAWAQTLGAAMVAPGLPIFREGQVRIDIEIRPRPRMKRLDDDNFWAAMKHYRDGLADAGIVLNDKQFVIGTLVWSKQRTSELIVTLTEVG